MSNIVARIVKIEFTTLNVVGQSDIFVWILSNFEAVITMSSKHQLIIYGYLRNILIENERDYSSILQVIMLFYHQGFAKYFDEKKDKDYRKKMKFGDIVKMDVDFHTFMILDASNELKKVGSARIDPYPISDDDPNAKIYIHVSIPFSICAYLSNAISFYSKLLQVIPFKNAIEYQCSFTVKHNDEWILKHLNGPLNPEFTCIEIKLYDGNKKFDGIYVSFASLVEIYFDAEKYEFNYQSINNYFEIRKDKNNLIKFKVSLRSEDKISDEIWYAVSVLWERTHKYNSKFVDAPDDIHLIIYFVGPKYEKNAMIDRFKGLYGDRFDDIVCLDKVVQDDYIL